MRTLIRHVGVTDKNDRVHAVSFTGGVNIITGRSSTGKSALIEIFDYCFGSNDFTVPEGVITECAEIYFVVIQVGSSWLVLARQKANTKRAFIKLEPDPAIVESKDSFVSDFFEDKYFIPLDDFKRTLRHYFGANLQITDIDESQEDRPFRGSKRKPTPSIRSFTSFMLQHQNLVANKHAIFYRFDEKEKREQVIEHFKVFAGFADQEYFLAKQNLERLKLEKKHIELQIPRQSEIKEQKKRQIHDAQKEYLAISGKKLDLGPLDSAVSSPQIALDALSSHKIDVIATSDDYADLKSEGERKVAQLTAAYRKQQNLIKDIGSSIEFAKNYTSEAKSTIVPSNAEVYASKCPFCHNYHDSVEQHANKLASAIDWLNNELGKSHYSLDSFAADLHAAQEKLNALGNSIQVERNCIQKLESHVKDLERYRTQHELALKAKLKIESYFEELLLKPDQKLEQNLADINQKIKKISQDLKSRYNIEKHMRNAEKKIAEYMAEIASSLDFEKSYKPICLNFSLETFDLWNEKEKRKIYLRSMGSGANWLSCHITLFLALNRYFCGLGDKCAIPTTVFFDQPSQVYFPSILDVGQEFSEAVKAAKGQPNRKRSVDEDMKAVTNLYSELVRFCKATLKSTGIEPQIIVTDHADKLELSGEVNFESLVRARWRTDDAGFIDLARDKDDAKEIIRDDC